MYETSVFFDLSQGCVESIDSSRLYVEKCRNFRHFERTCRPDRQVAM